MPGFGRTPVASKSNKVNLLPLDGYDYSKTGVKTKGRKLIDVTEVSDFQPLQFGSEKPWEVIHNGILKQDMAG